MSEFTRLLNELQETATVPTGQLLALVYEELRLMAKSKLDREGNAQSIQATMLVHEAFLRLTSEDGSSAPTWQNRSHFFGAASEAMRRILVDAARKRQAIKHGGKLERSEIELGFVEAPVKDEKLLAIHDVVDRLEELDPRAGQLVKLRFFTGLKMSEIAEVLGVSVRSTNDIWTYAKAWLRKEFGPED